MGEKGSIIADADTGMKPPFALSSYASPDPLAWDEARDPSGQWRPGWAEFVARLERMGAGQLDTRWNEAKRLIRENGVSYNVFGDPTGMERPWQLDPLPLLIEPTEWRSLEASLLQYAKLCDLVLRDLYGPQRLLREGLIPAGLIHASPRYLRNVRGLEAPGPHRLTFLAVDLARGADGGWRVVSNLTEPLLGAGYALENRIAMSRTLPNKFRESNVHRLAEFFAQVQRSVLAVSPRRENPRVVIVSAGPEDPAYFEHAYLSRYLGFTLAEASDLLVRDGAVFLKTLRGLYGVDVAVLRMRDDDCDPLEFNGAAAAGVAALLRAARGGKVTLINTPGSFILESPALRAYLPSLAPHLLGEPLALGATEVWWCGDERQRREALQRREQVEFVPADGVPLRPSARTTSYEDIRQRLQRRPETCAAVEPMRLSSVPVWHEGTVGSRHALLRVFLVARQDQTGGGYLLMPGGLALTYPRSPISLRDLRRAEGSKDVWVRSESAVSSFSLLAASTAPLALIRGGYYLPSRVADNLFWLGRYTERAECLTRALRTLISLAGDPTRSSDGDTLASARLAAEASFGDSPAEPAQEPSPTPLTAESLEALALHLGFNPKDPRTLRNTLSQVDHVAWRVRDRLASDAWRRLYDQDRDLDETRARGLHGPEALDALDRVLTRLESFAGHAHDGMTLGQGWRFLMIGRRLERAAWTAHLMRRCWTPHDATDLGTLELVLTLANSVLTYRSRYLTTMQAAPAIDLLLMDETNPRSVAFQLAELATHEAVVSEGARAPTALRSTESKLILDMLNRVRLSDAEALARRDTAGARSELASLLSHLEAALPRLSDSLTQTHFSHAQPVRTQALLAAPPGA